MRRVATLFAMVAVGSLVPSAAALAPGDPPTFDFPRCFREIRPCGDPIVLGETHNFTGRLEVVGMSSGIGPCVSFETIREGFAYGTCGSKLRPRRNDVATIDGVGFSGPPGAYTQISGYLEDAVTRLEARWRRNGEPKQTGAGIVHVDAGGADAIGAETEFSAFELTIRGCIPVKRMRLLSFDSSGALMGRDRMKRVFNFCNFDADPVESSGPGARFAPDFQYRNKTDR